MIEYNELLFKAIIAFIFVIFIIVLLYLNRDFGHYWQSYQLFITARDALY